MAHMQSSRLAAESRYCAAQEASRLGQIDSDESDEPLREMLTEQAHANRISMMGQLAGSIPHELNQPIAAMITNAEAALRWLRCRPPDLESVRHSLVSIVQDGNRARDVIGCMQALVKKAPPRKDQVEINGVIRETIELIRGKAMKNGVSIQADLANDLPILQGVRVQLQQVFLNLIINAIEAMSNVNEGARELLVATSRAEARVLVTVQDSGPGLTPEALEHVFDPFYTTKPNGLGLGLSICRSIIEAHGERLWASANERCGATFHFTLSDVVDRSAHGMKPDRPPSHTVDPNISPDDQSRDPWALDRGKPDRSDISYR